MLQDCTT